MNVMQDMYRGAITRMMTRCGGTLEPSRPKSNQRKLELNEHGQYY